LGITGDEVASQPEGETVEEQVDDQEEGERHLHYDMCDNPS
jgi:hypothetical protein